MARTIKIGAQGFEGIRTNGSFYVDKTDFVRDWWLAQDDVTLDETLAGLRQVIRGAVRAHDYLRDSDALTNDDRAFLARVSDDMPSEVATSAINQLCSMLRRHHGVAPVVLLDEYDAPMECAWTQGYWEGASSFMRQLMNATFKTNPALGRGLITGVTRVSREPIFSDLNNLVVVTSSTPLYQTCFGFTQDEVDAALAEYGLAEKRDAVRDWYDGFTFGGVGHVYNP